jgi:CDP-Glycerol:Poly(glycerophosphate) glycerophosphotransferase
MTTAVAATTPLANAKLLAKPFVLRLKDKLKRISYGRHIEHGSLNWPTNHTVLCLGFTSYMYRDVLEPVIERLTAESGYKAVVLSDKPYPLKDQKFNNNVLHQQLWQYWDHDMDQQLCVLRKSVRQVEAELRASKALNSLLPKSNRRISEALNKVFNLLFRCYLPLILQQAIIAKHILSKHRPGLVLSPDASDARTRLYTLLSRQMNIPSINVQFGLTGDEGVEWRFFSADYAAVWGDTSKNVLLKQKVQEKKILVTGSPRHDSMVRPSLLQYEKTRGQLGLLDKRPVILLASTYSDSTHSKFVRPGVQITMKKAIFDAAEKNSEIVLVVKPHPCENVEETRALAGNAENIVFADRESDIRDLIVICDAFVSFGSTATIDALIADKLSICPIFPGWPFSESFRESGAVLVPESPEQIKKIFDDIANKVDLAREENMKSARQNYLSAVVYKADGLASERIKNQIVKMMV